MNVNIHEANPRNMKQVATRVIPINLLPVYVVTPMSLPYRLMTSTAMMMIAVVTADAMAKNRKESFGHVNTMCKCATLDSPTCMWRWRQG
jgi:hypothetical protein